MVRRRDQALGEIGRRIDRATESRIHGRRLIRSGAGVDRALPARSAVLDSEGLAGIAVGSETPDGDLLEHAVGARFRLTVQLEDLSPQQDALTAPVPAVGR